MIPQIIGFDHRTRDHFEITYWYLSPSVSSFVSVFVTFGFRYGSFSAGFNKFNLQYLTIYTD